MFQTFSILYLSIYSEIPKIPRWKYVSQCNTKELNYVNNVGLSVTLILKVHVQDHTQDCLYIAFTHSNLKNSGMY